MFTLPFKGISVLLCVAMNNEKFLMLLDLVTRKKGNELWKVPSSQCLLAEILGALTFIFFLYTWSNNSCFSFSFHFSFFSFYWKFITSVFLYIFYLQSNKTTLEGREAHAQKIQHFHIVIWSPETAESCVPGACSLLGSLFQGQHHQSREDMALSSVHPPFPSAHLASS